MYLSRVELDTDNYQVRRVLGSPRVVHGIVEGCFLEAAETRDLGTGTRTSATVDRKLWRVDSINGKTYLLVLSSGKPDFTGMAARYCAEGAVGETKDYDPLLESVQRGRRYRFRLCANAVRSVPCRDAKRGKVFAHVTVAQQEGWLKSRAERNGFILDEGSFGVVGTGQARFWKRGEKDPVTLGLSVFEGELEVSDRELFVKALTQGIGRAKAYGCGLLTVAKPI